MPRRTQLSAEAIRHIASGEIGIHAAKKKYGIGESRVLRIRQGLEVARDNTLPAKKDEEVQDKKDEVLQDKNGEEALREVQDRDAALQAIAHRISIFDLQEESPAAQQKSKKRRRRKK